MRSGREQGDHSGGETPHGAYISVQPPTVVECVTSRGGTSGKGDSSVGSNADR